MILGRRRRGRRMGGWGMIRGLDESEGEQGKEERTKEGGKQNGNRKRSPSSSSSSGFVFKTAGVAD